MPSFVFNPSIHQWTLFKPRILSLKKFFLSAQIGRKEWLLLPLKQKHILVNLEFQKWNCLATRIFNSQSISRRYVLQRPRAAVGWSHGPLHFHWLLKLGPLFNLQPPWMTLHWIPTASFQLISPTLCYVRIMESGCFWSFKWIILPSNQLIGKGQGGMAIPKFMSPNLFIFSIDFYLKNIHRISIKKNYK